MRVHPLRDLLLYHGRHRVRLKRNILEGPPVPLLPNPTGRIYDQSAGLPSSLLGDSCNRLIPQLIEVFSIGPWRSPVCPFQVKIFSLTLFDNEHSSAMCCTVSGWILQSLQIGSCGQPRIAKLSAVRSCHAVPSMRRICTLPLQDRKSTRLNSSHPV